MIDKYNSIIDLVQAFKTEEDCIKHLEKIRWNGNVVSPFDATSKVYVCSNNRYKCKNTGKYFNVKVGTIFEDTKIALIKWFMALYIFESHKKGISSHQLAKDIGVTQKSAWFILHRLRYGFAHPNFERTLSGDIELDETYMGGDEKNKHADKKTKGSQGRSTKTKKPVFGLLERGGEVVAHVVDDTKQKTLEPIITTTLCKVDNVFTDEWHAYNNLNKKYNHSVVHHAANEYVNGLAHTNGIENFWSHMKRGVDGIYHWVSVKHLQSYVDEFSLRFNTRKLNESGRFDLTLFYMMNRRLTYDNLTQKV